MVQEQYGIHLNEDGSVDPKKWRLRPGNHHDPNVAAATALKGKAPVAPLIDAFRPHYLGMYGPDELKEICAAFDIECAQDMADRFADVCKELIETCGYARAREVMKSACYMLNACGLPAEYPDRE